MTQKEKALLKKYRELSTTEKEVVDLLIKKIQILMNIH